MKKIEERRRGREDIIIALSHHPDLLDDVNDLVCRMTGIGKRTPMADRLQIVIDAEDKVIDFIIGLGEDQLTKFDSDVYVENFKEYERIWASRKNEGTKKENWNKMKEELSEYISGNSKFAVR